MQRHYLVRALCAILIPFYARTIHAQTSLRVLRYTPTDTASASSIITVTFNRPVAGMLDQTIDARRVIHIEPEVKGVAEWRDPITVRFVPDEPLAAGKQFEIAIDTAAAATSGARTGTPYRFTIRVPEAKLLIGFVDDAYVGGSGIPSLGPNPRFRALYSSAVDPDSIEAMSVLKFPATCGGPVHLRVVRQRPVEKNDPYEMRGWYNRDAVASRPHRVVEMVVRDSIPLGCEGQWTIPFASTRRGLATQSYPIRTYPEFKIDSIAGCLRDDFGNPATVCDPNGLVAWFSTPVNAEMLNRHVHSSPILPHQAMDGTSSAVVFNTPLKPRQLYTVSADTSLRDVFGRSLTGANSISVIARDRAPGVRYQAGLVTFSPSAPTFTVRTVNVDTLMMSVANIPDSLLGRVAGSFGMGRYNMLSLLAPKVPTTLRVAIPVHGAFNQDTQTEVRLPSSMILNARSLATVRFTIQARSVHPDSVALAESTQKLAKASTPLPDFGLITQISALRVHSKIDGNTGAVFVTDLAGHAVAGARIALVDEWQRHLATALSDNNGLATLHPVPAESISVASKQPDLLRGSYPLHYLEIIYRDDRLVAPVYSSYGNPFDELDARTLSMDPVSPGGRAHGAVFTDRGIYRPGEYAHIKIYVRYGMVGSIGVPPLDSVRVSVSRSNDWGYSVDTEHSKVFPFNEFGAVADSVLMPGDMRTGKYLVSADARVNGTWQSVGNREIQIADFRPPDYLVTLATDTALHYAGDTIRVNVDAKYLFGAPMHGAAVQWTAFARKDDGLDNTIPGTHGFTIGNSNWWEEGEQSGYTNFGAGDTLDSLGHLTLRIPTDAVFAAAPSKMIVQAAVTDVNNQTVTKSVTIRLRAASLSVAARRRTSEWYWKTGVRQTIDAFVVRPDGERVAGVPLTATIVRRRWIRDSSKSAEPYRWLSDTVAHITVMSKNDSVPIQFTPEDNAAYDVRIEARDEAGRVASTNLGQWACPDEWTIVSRENPVRLRVRAPSGKGELFSLGDTAHVSFDSPFERAVAWITLEREGVSEQRTMNVRRGTTSLPFVITPKFAPNVWVGIVLLKQNDSAITHLDSTQEVMRAGYAELRVDTTVHTLHVAIRPRTSELSAGDSAVVRVEVRDRNIRAANQGVKSEVTLWAVDEGALSMTDYRTPDILQEIDRRLGVSPRLNTSLSRLPWRTVSGALRPGVSYDIYDRSSRMEMSVVAIEPRAATFDFDATETKTRKTFRLTAFFVGSAITDADGNVEVHTRLPDNITTFRLMATAVTTGEGYGSAEGELRVTQRVVLRPSLPRFVRKGDSLSTSTVVNLRDSVDATIFVRAAVNDTMLRGDSVNRIHIGAMGGSRTPFTIVVPEHTDVDSLRIQLSALDSASHSGDAIQSAIPIREAGTARAHSTIGMLRENGSVTISLPGNIDPKRSTVSINLGTSPLVAMRTQYARLRDYSLQNTETIITTARALLAIARTEREMNDRVLTRDSIKVERELQEAIDEIARREIGDRGVFSNWSDRTRAEDAWFSAYIGMFFLDAERGGLKIPMEINERIAANLKTVLAEKSWRSDTLGLDSLARQAYVRQAVERRMVALQYLREADSPMPAVEDSLVAVSRLLAWEDRVALVGLMFRRPELQLQARAMLQKLWNSVSVVGRRIEFPDSLRRSSPYPSHIRPAARLMTVTMRVMPDHPLLGALAETVIQQGSIRRDWEWNSIDYASAIEALGSFASTQSSGNAAKVIARAMDGRVIFSASTSSASHASLSSVDEVVPLNGLLRKNGKDSTKLTLSMRIEPNAADTASRRAHALYYSVTVNEIPLQRPVTPDMAGIFVERWYERFDNGKPLTEVHEGDLVRVRLRVTVPSDRQYVAVEDMLPAGLEAIDLSLRTSATVGPFVTRDTVPQRRLSRDDDDDDNDDDDLQVGGPASYTTDGGWWSPWEHKEIRDDRVLYFARQLWSGSYTATYLARATTAGTFVKPPAHAEEMYNRALQGRSDGGVFVVRPKQ